MTMERVRLTVADYQAFTSLPENAERLFELVDGELVEKMASYTPSKIAMTIGRHIGNWLDVNPIGTVTGADGGYILNDENVRMPDVGYISNVNRGAEPEREVLVPPDLAVEVMSPTDSKRALRRKALRYLDLGTQMVWLVFPQSQEVEVYLPDDTVTVVDINGVLEGGAVLPGFKLPVRDMFR